MNYAIRIEIRDNPERDRFWDAVKRFEEKARTDREKRQFDRFVGKYLDRIRNYEDAAIISWEIHYWRRLPVGASLIVLCGGPNCVRPSHMRVEVPKPLCRVCCEEDGLISGDQYSEERGN